MKAAIIDRIVSKANAIKENRDDIKPGQPVRISEAASVGDFVRQGDLYLIVSDKVPSGYVKATAKNKSVQLVPGNTEGAKHCLDSLAAVDLYYPKDWPNAESLDGPCVVAREGVTVLHPTHGSVFIPAGTTVHARYQREWDAEQKRERRNAD